MEKCAVAKSFPGSIFISVIVVAGIMKIKYILPTVCLDRRRPRGAVFADTPLMTILSMDKTSYR